MPTNKYNISEIRKERFVSKNMFTPFAPSVKWTEWETQIKMSWALAHSQNVHLVTLLDLTQFEEASKFHLDPVLRKPLLARHQWKATTHLAICETLFCKRPAYQWCLYQIIYNQTFKWTYHELITILVFSKRFAHKWYFIPLMSETHCLLSLKVQQQFFFWQICKLQT